MHKGLTDQVNNNTYYSGELTYEILEKYVKELDEFDKTKIYLDYCITQLYLKYDFEVRNLKKHTVKCGDYLHTVYDDKLELKTETWGIPHKVFLGIGFYWLWKDINICRFEDFDYKDWYRKFKERIEL